LSANALVWHEIVNDRFPSSALSIPYCPLTGSAVAFCGTAPGGAYTFGTPATRSIPTC
jgi:Protein of unknown function (DUF3179)